MAAVQNLYTTTKGITIVNHNTRRQHNEPIRNRNRRHAQYNTRD